MNDKQMTLEEYEEYTVVCFRLGFRIGLTCGLFLSALIAIAWGFLYA